MRVRVSRQRLGRRSERSLLSPLDRIDLHPIEHEHGLEQHHRVPSLLARQRVTVLDREWYWRSPVKPQCRIRLAETQTEERASEAAKWPGEGAAAVAAAGFPVTPAHRRTPSRFWR